MRAKFFCRLVSIFFLCAAASFAALGIERAVLPDTTACKIQIGDAPASHCSVPLSFQTEQSSAYIEFTFRPGRFSSGLYQVAADDCVEFLEINGRVIVSRDQPLCLYPIGKVFDLSAVLRAGDNQFRVLVANGGGLGQLLIRPAPWSSTLLAVRLALVAVLALAGLLVMAAAGGRWSIDSIELWILGGFAARLIYYFSTPYWTRSYDWTAHVQYVEYVLAHWVVPPASAGWEFYQPPLYYFAAAVFQKLCCPPPRSFVELGVNLGGFSLLISAGALTLMLGVCDRLLRTERCALRGAALAALALFPGIAAFSTRVTNDQFQMLFGFALIAAALKLLRTGRIQGWAAAGAAAACGLLSKTSAAAVLPVPLIALLASSLAWTRRLSRAALYVGVSALFISPYLYQRHVVEGEETFLGRETMQNLNPALRLQNDLRNFLVFNPLEVVRLAYNDPWRDSERRQWFWEYLYRSAFFGETGQGERLKLPAQAVLSAGFLVLVFAAWGAISVFFRERTVEDFLMGALLLLNLGALLAFRVGYPFSPCQDFRHIPTAILPVIYFAAARQRASRSATAACSVLAVAQAAYYLVLYFSLPPVHVF